MNLSRFVVRNALWMLASFAIINMPLHVTSAAGISDSVPHDPKLISVVPLGGQRGQVVSLTIRGNWIDGATAAWFGEARLSGKVMGIQASTSEIPLKMKLLDKRPPQLPIFVIQVRLTIDSAVKPGAYPLRLVTPQGVSNHLMFLVTDGTATAEAAISHQSPDLAQAVTVPSVISGELSQHGELDYYSFHARRGEQISVEVLHQDNFDARLAIYEPGGSWFDPHRPRRLLSEQERRSDLMPTRAGGTYRFLHDGNYFLEVSGLYGEGCTGCAYLVGISSTDSPDDPVKTEKAELTRDWVERDFSRILNPSWGEALIGRNVPNSLGIAASATVPTFAAAAGGEGAPARIALDAGIKPDLPARSVMVYKFGPPQGSNAAQAPSIKIPSLIEGAISRPGEINSYRFSVTSGQKLAFEIETPDEKPPHFNPRIGIIDSQDKEVFSNVHRAISLFNNNGEKFVYLKQVEPKVVYTFAHGGDYLLQIRDITSHYGGPDYRYRILIRQQIPHVGEFTVAKSDYASNTKENPIPEFDHINLAPGKTQKMDIRASYEENFSGDLSFSVKGLPQGVELLPGAENRGDRAPMDIDEDPGLIAPKIQKTTMILFASPEARPTPLPILAQLICRPIAGGVPGPEILVKEIPVMIVSPPAPIRAVRQ